MNKVYLVWQGKYSDKGVIAVYDKLRDAEVHAARIDGGCYITKHEIGKIKYKEDATVGYNIRLRCGKEGVRWRTIDSYCLPKIGRNRPIRNKVYEWGDYCYSDGSRDYKVMVVADSEENALKIASDLVAQYRAEKAGL